jgi:hypothetical protein
MHLRGFCYKKDVTFLLSLLLKNRMAREIHLESGTTCAFRIRLLKAEVNHRTMIG